MNLMKYFNRNYMFQNIKKSKAILSFFLGMIPILSILISLTLFTNVNYDGISLESISIIHYIGIYFIPIILSICLFGFVYKKKSVDFMNSMPISRKSMFMTNTITGMLLLVLMVIFSALGVYGISIICGIFLPFRMIVDYILIWSITYIFVFILSNLAMSVSGNMITQIVVTLLLLFLLPFTIEYLFFFYGNYTTYHLCFDSVESSCYYVYQNNLLSFTLPYYNIRNVFDSMDSLWNTASLIKMVIISIIGYFLGKFLFIIRKMEINETSFSNLKVHNFVKALTLFPIVALIMAMIPEGTHSLLLDIFVLVMLIIYYFIYDLITKKQITQIQKSLIHFAITIIILFSICGSIQNYHNHHHYVRDQEITVTEENVNQYRFSLYSTELTEFDYVKIKNKDSINMITDILKDKKEYQEGNIIKEMMISIGKKEYKITVYFSSNDYDRILNQIKKTKDIKGTKTILDTGDVYGLYFNHWGFQKFTTDRKVINAARQAIQKNEKYEDTLLQVEICLYAYQNGVIYTYPVSTTSSKELTNYVVKSIQEEQNELLKKIKNRSYNSSYYTHNLKIKLKSYPSSSTSLNFNELENLLTKNQELVYYFIKEHQNELFKAEEEFITLSIKFDNQEYVYHTNQVENMIQMLVHTIEDDSDDTN